MWSVTARRIRARTRYWSNRSMCSTRAMSDASAPSQTSASARTMAAAKGAGRQYGERSMTAGGRPSANSTFPVRSPWMSWLGARIGRRADARRATCFASAKSPAGSLSQATRSPVAQDRYADPKTAAEARRRSPVERLTGADDVDPAAGLVGTDEEATGVPVFDRQHESSIARRGSDTRKPSLAMPPSRSACHSQLLHRSVQRLQDDAAGLP